jgi:hypothetical protein
VIDARPPAVASATKPAPVAPVALAMTLTASTTTAVPGFPTNAAMASPFPAIAVTFRTLLELTPA